jgi:Fe-S oxidoreductase
MSEIDNILENCTGCKQCVEECDFLQRHCSSPKELAESFKAGKHKANPQIPYSCNICSLCEVRCPKKLNIGKMCFAARRQLVQEGLAPLEQHQPLAKGLDWNESDAFKVALPASFAGDTKGITTRVFFPGCALSAYSPDLVLKAYDYLQGKLPGTGIVLGCCGAPAYLIADQQRFDEVIDGIESDLNELGCSEIITACPYCHNALKHHLPNLRITSLYQILEEIWIPEVGLQETNAAEKHTFSIHDPCSTRFEPEIQSSIRKLIQAAGYEVCELEHSRDSTHCCGLGGMAFAVDSNLSAKKAKRTVQESKHDLVTYCASCRGNLASQGASILHILDLIFGESWQEKRVAPSAEPSNAQENQRALKMRLLARQK